VGSIPIICSINIKTPSKRGFLFLFFILIYNNNMNNKIKTSFIEDYKEHRTREFLLWESLLVAFGYILPFFVKSILYSFLKFNSETQMIIDILFIVLPVVLALVFIGINRYVALEQPIVQWFIVFYGLSLLW
jgi:hypothetical protein